MADRHRFRAEWHDYNEGVYFVTICCAEQRHYFGHINNGEIILNNIGIITRTAIEKISLHFLDVEILNSVVMPNHIHLIIAVGTRHGASASASASLDDGGASASEHIRTVGCLNCKRHEPKDRQDFHHNSRLAVIVGQLKSAIKREANKRNIPFAWQQRFHEHIIRNRRSFNNIMNYIETNIQNWIFDKFNQNRIDNADAPWCVPTGE